MICCRSNQEGIQRRALKLATHLITIKACTGYMASVYTENGRSVMRSKECIFYDYYKIQWNMICTGRNFDSSILFASVVNNDGKLAWPVCLSVVREAPVLFLFRCLEAGM